MSDGTSTPVGSGRALRDEGRDPHAAWTDEPFQEVELVATRAADALRRALTGDALARERLLEVLRHVSTRQSRVGEWQALRRALRRVLVSLSPFTASLSALVRPMIEPGEGRDLLYSWRPCQAEVDRLMDCGTRLFSSSRHDETEGLPNWNARILLLRREIEDRLREEAWSVEGLIDLADELRQACDCYLDLADTEAHRILRETRRLCAHLLGGLS